MTEMRALVLSDFGSLEVRTVPRPEPGPGEVLVRVLLTGICGSDVHGYTGENGRRAPGQVMGHESSGTVAVLGEGANGPPVGTPVTFNPTMACRACTRCRNGAGHLCADRRVIGVDPSWPAAMADYLLVPASNLVELPSGTPDWAGALVEPLAVGRHAVARAGITADDLVLVMGAGPIGQAAILAAQADNAGAVLVSEPDPARRKLAQQLGANAVAPAELQEALLQLTGGAGVAASVDAVGIDATLSAALEATAPGGRVVLVGMGSPSVAVPAYAISTQERMVVGAFCYTDAEFRETAASVAAATDRLAPLVSAVVSPSEADAAFRRLADGQSGLSKVLIDFRESR